MNPSESEQMEEEHLALPTEVLSVYLAQTNSVPQSLSISIILSTLCISSVFSKRKSGRIV
jgi:hypothetical protein